MKFFPCIDERCVQMKEKNLNIISWILFAVFSVMFVYGSTTSEVIVVFRKSVRICLECIGIG